MPYPIPTVRQLRERMLAAIDSAAPRSNVYLVSSTINLLITGLSGVLFGAYQFGRYILNQIFPRTASRDSLDEHASLWGLERLGAIASTGDVTLNVLGSGTASVGGEELTRPDGRVMTVESTTALPITNGQVTASVRMSEAGVDGDTAAGVAVSPRSTSSVIVSGVVAAGGLTGGRDLESDEALHVRVDRSYKERTTGATKEDYESWMREIEGVTRVWVSETTPGAGSVTVYYVLDGRSMLPYADSNVFPDATHRQLAQDYIAGRRPLGTVTVIPALTPVSLNLQLSVVPDTPEVRAQVSAAVAEFLRREAAPGKSMPLSRLQAAISSAPLETSHVLTSPDPNVATFSPGASDRLYILGTVTWGTA